MKFIIFILFFLALLPEALANETLRVQSLMEPFKIYDQHGNSQLIDKKIKLIIFIFDKKGNDLLYQSLKDKPSSFLKTLRTVCISDIRVMPFFIRKLAISTMKKYPYPIFFLDSTHKAYQFPGKKGKLSIIRTNTMLIKSIKFIDDPEILMKEIQKAGQSAGQPLVQHNYGIGL